MLVKSSCHPAADITETVENSFFFVFNVHQVSTVVVYLCRLASSGQRHLKLGRFELDEKEKYKIKWDLKSNLVVHHK